MYLWDKMNGLKTYLKFSKNTLLKSKIKWTHNFLLRAQHFYNWMNYFFRKNKRFGIYVLTNNHYIAVQIPTTISPGMNLTVSSLAIPSPSHSWNWLICHLIGLGLSSFAIWSYAFLVLTEDFLSYFDIIRHEWQSKTMH